MPETLELNVQQDYVEALAKLRKPLLGIEELIWNCLDADAFRVQVSLEFDTLGHLSKIMIQDDGHGMSHDECRKTFGNLGGSAKLNKKFTPLGRLLHGHHGKGRFKAFGLGKKVSWLSRYEKSEGEIQEFRVDGKRSTIKRFTLSDPKQSQARSAGVVVTISDIELNLPSLSRSQIAAQELSSRLALYLKNYPGINIVYDGFVVDPKELETFTKTYKVTLSDSQQADQDGELTVIEWSNQCPRALYFCDPKGFALHDCPPGIQAPGYNFTAYLKSPLIDKLCEEGAFAAEHIHPVVLEIMKTAKDALRSHFRHREASRSGELIDQWKRENVYPYTTEALDPVSEAEKQVFDVCALKVHEYLPNFDKSERKNKRLTFRLEGVMHFFPGFAAFFSRTI